VSDAGPNLEIWADTERLTASQAISLTRVKCSSVFLIQYRLNQKPLAVLVPGIELKFKGLWFYKHT